jgi:hypothetical protein
MSILFSFTAMRWTSHDHLESGTFAGLSLFRPTGPPTPCFIGPGWSVHRMYTDARVATNRGWLAMFVREPRALGSVHSAPSAPRAAWSDLLM